MFSLILIECEKVSESAAENFNTMSGEWKHGTFECFDNIGLCIISYILPCYQFGLNAEATGESCMTCAIAYVIPIVNLYAAVQIRGRIREQHGIVGSTANDLMMICCCPICSLVQEAQEMKEPGLMSMARV